jgi:hypothetical protein
MPRSNEIMWMSNAQQYRKHFCLQKRERVFHYLTFNVRFWKNSKQNEYVFAYKNGSLFAFIPKTCAKKDRY